jgi:hypothetical protein
MQNKQENKTSSFTRRDFLVSLGVGTSLAIAGFFMFDKEVPTIESNSDAIAEKPGIADGVTKTLENDQIVLHKNNSKCILNNTGGKIIDLLDGNNDLYSISKKISSYYTIDHTDALEVSIASFLCQLGASGFLASPYYVIMYETT